MDTTYLIVICLGYLISTFFVGIYLKSYTLPFLRWGRLGFAFSLSLHLGFLVSYFYEKKIWVPSNSWESQLAISALLGIVLGLLVLKRSFLGLTFYVTPLLCLSLICFAYFGRNQVPSELPNPWLWTHILLAVLGEAFFFVSALIAVGYLVFEFRLRHKFIPTWISSLPSLSAYDDLLGENILAGFILLTAGLLAGVFFAGSYWSSDWYFDPKVILATLTWFIYAVLIVLRTVKPSFKGRRSAILSALGFVGIIFLSLGMDFLIPSQHHLGKTEVQNHDTQDSGN